MIDLIVLCVLASLAGALLAALAEQIAALRRESRKARARSLARERHKLLAETAARNRAQIVHDLEKGVL